MDSQSRAVFAVITVMAYMGMGAEAQNTAGSGIISRANCGITKFCASQPEGCDPSVSGSCFFVSASLNSGQNFSFQLQGQSNFYVALVLSTTFIMFPANLTMGQIDFYACYNINYISNISNIISTLGITIPNVLPSNLVMGSVSGQTIQCIFSAIVPNATSTKSSSTSFFISIYNGTVINGVPGIPKLVYVSTAAVDLSNPTATATNSGLQRTLSQALLILLGGLVFIML
ncbi:putative ferric-chelate reductase 1 [Esox lucius]|uniref:putative ferric-chelate reductase 1 n=1 Tax=Esox lucius TaxID=8010 RepID=UPI0014771CCC|nr:putative ferric-chelate reductase 1 [Esox lucius]